MAAPGVVVVASCSVCVEGGKGVTGVVVGVIGVALMGVEGALPEDCGVVGVC